MAKMPETKTPRSLGILGLGLIGSRVAQLLSQAGHEVWVWNRTPRPIPRSVGQPSDLPPLAETLLIFVKDGPALLSCVEQLLPALGPRHLVVNHATVGPREARTASQLLEKTGAGFLNAPFTGSRDAAAAGALVYYVGGESELLERVRSILQVSARAILPIGSLEAAATIKLATNLMAASIVASLAEAWKLAEHAGISGETFRQALELNAVRSGTSDLKVPCILHEDFAPRFSLANMVKDIHLAAALAEEAGFTSKQAAAFLEAAAPALEQGLAEADFSVIAQTSGKP